MALLLILFQAPAPDRLRRTNPIQLAGWAAQVYRLSHGAISCGAQALWYLCGTLGVAVFGGFRSWEVSLNECASR